MKDLIKHIKKGLIVYTTLALQKINQLSIEKLKSNPKEAFVKFSDIVSVSTTDMPDNWISIKVIEGNKTYFEDRSIINFINIAKKNGVLFQKLTGKLAVNISLLKYKSNLTVVELINGDTYTVNRRYKGQLKTALLNVWEE
jgi:hypothetical protein